MFEVFKNIGFFSVDCHDLKVRRKNSGRGFLVYFVHWGFFFVVFRGFFPCVQEKKTIAVV